MATLSKKHQEIVARAHLDPAFRMQLLKALMKLALEADPNLLEKALEKIEK